MSCRDVRDWLHRDAEALDESRRLVLDDHLASCERCRGDRGRMRLVHQLGTSLQVPPPNYNRAIARALLEGAPRREPAPARRTWLVPVLAVGVAAVIAIVVQRVGDRSEDVALVLPPPMPRAPDPPEPPRPPVASPDLVEDGTIEHGGTALSAGDTVPPDVTLRAPERARIRLATARVVIAASSELTWTAVDRTILLDRGSLDVESSASGIARVVAKSFEVAVGNADVVIDAISVQVRRGVVRITHAQRSIEVSAGTTWTPERKPVEPPVAEVLARARRELAAKRFDAASKLASSVIAKSAPRPQLAEALTLLADIALASGRLDAAVERYLIVSARFRDQPAAESALYAAIRIRLRQQKASARDLLDRYLATYPDGRYAVDARRQLATLGAPR